MYVVKSVAKYLCLSETFLWNNNIHHEWINNSTFIALINELHEGKRPSWCRAHWSIDSTDTTTDTPRLDKELTSKGNRMAHTRPAAAVWVRTERISYRPAPAPAPLPQTCCAPLPELRRIVTRLDTPALRPRCSPLASAESPAHTHTAAFRPNI